MVKRGGTKRKITKLEKITKRAYLATAFSKRCSGIYSKAPQLCLLGDAQIAILATPPSSQSNVSFFSFGHSSVDAVVNAYLTGQRLAPVREGARREEDIGVVMARKELGLELWWEKESLAKSKNPQELMEAVKAMDKVLCKLREFLERDSQSDDVVLQQETQEVDETQLNLQATCCVPDDDKITEDEDQNIKYGLVGSLDQEEVDIDELIDWNSIELSDIGVLDSTHGNLLMNVGQAVNPNPSPIFVSEEEANLVGQNKGWDANEDDLSFPIYDFEGVEEEEGFVFQNRALDEENLKFIDYFN